MENASKALLIAGAILMTMIIVGFLIIMSNNMNSAAQASEEKMAHEQLVEFNQQYEAYNKKLLYGTDVITVINRAIENNKKMDESTPWFINVQITVNQDFVTNINTVTTNLTTGKSEEKTNKEGKQLSANKTYYLMTGANKMDNTIINFFNTPASNPEPKTVENKTTKQLITKYTYYALNDFKSAIFECKGLEYKEGRVSKITFAQKIDIIH